jgi:amino-acid N-acetyltransferase
MTDVMVVDVGTRACLVEVDDAVAAASLAGWVRAAGLPAEDLDGSRMTFFGLADEQGALGWAALERHGPDALLRSVLTVADRRSSGIGSSLVRRVSALAADEGVERLWLLTETAAPFFKKLGFAETERASAPAAMLQTTEFRDVCPASATCMTLTLVRS